MTDNLINTGVKRLWDELNYAYSAANSGALPLESPHKVGRMLVALLRFGTLGGVVTMSALRFGDRIAVIDEKGSISFRELDLRSNALANAWRKSGLRAGDGVAILARNHRGFHEAVFAAAKCGARIILLNTDFAGPQIREVATRESTDLLVFDDEYTNLLGDVEPRLGRWRAWANTPGTDTIDAAIAGSSTSMPARPGGAPKIILLTSGTTGTPKGAPRPEPRSLAPLGAIFGKVPFKARGVTECPAPMFHTLGFAHAMLAIGLGSTLVIRRKFNPQKTIDSVAEHRATALIVVPVMLARMVELGYDARAGRDLSALKIIFVAGSQLGAELCKRAMAAFGPVVYNLYGSTEVAYASIATPEDLAAEPGCVGKVVRGAVVKVIDDDGAALPAGSVGRIFVGNSIQFEGYTGGGSKEIVDGLMCSGDVGHFDSEGRLFIDGRDDDMIVSGGENVFPGEVEELLNGHEAIVEASVIGVDDEKHGQRLRAFVVLRDRDSVDADQLSAYVKENLARFKVPRDIVFLDELPRNPTGKVLKRELRAM